ncbi:PDE11 [Mytilus edulis]|uniref:PDE11 n=1 Tax=Mytilus edulis TaxID=6550 RepID=A0A8S3UF19_MYTED|nr:PDE11 [Mytilus edulis]
MSGDMEYDKSSHSLEITEEYGNMEIWLDAHPEFVHDYFARKAKKSMVDGWLLSHALAHSPSLQLPGDNNSSGSNSRNNSGTNTPVRKISAQEFDRGDTLDPIISTIDGTPTFLGPSTSCQSLSSKCHRRSRSELKALDEKELMYELVIDICNDLDVTRIIGNVAQTGEPLNIPDAYKDPRFNNEIDMKMGYKTRSILSMPIKDCSGKVIGVAQAVNKISIQEEPFDEHDEKVFGSYLAFCGIGLKNAQLYEKSLLENRRNQVLLDLARVIFEEQSNVANLIYKIMMHTQSLLQCARCQVMLIDDINVMDLFHTKLDKDKKSSENLDKKFTVCAVALLYYLSLHDESLQ